MAMHLFMDHRDAQLNLLLGYLAHTVLSFMAHNLQLVLLKFSTTSCLSVVKLHVTVFLPHR